MATILNKKEEVLKVELTKHGRKLLGQGILKPEYFSFFDDTAIYDQSFGGVTNEDQNNIKDRLLTEDLTFSAFNLLEDIELEPLGDSQTYGVNYEYAPAWEMNVLNGFLTINTGSSTYYKKYFDANPITYTIELLENTNNTIQQNYSIFNIDNKFLKLEEDYILLEIDEKYVADLNEKFEIEVVTFEEETGGEQAGLEKKLYFYEKQSNIIDGIIYAEEELPRNYMNINLTKDDVEFYLDVLVDDEIDSNLIRPFERPLVELVEGTYTSNFAGVVFKDPC